MAGHRAFQSYTQWLVIEHLCTVACSGTVQSLVIEWMYDCLYIRAALLTLIASAAAPRFQVQVQRWTSPASSAQFRPTLTPCGVGVSAEHDSSLFSGLASSRSSVHLQESGIVHNSGALTGLCSSVSGKEH